LATDYLQLLDSIGYDPTSVDTLVETSGLTPAEVSSMLLQLEMSGYVASSAGGMYNRLK
jgi:DNA processing protein